MHQDGAMSEVQRVGQEQLEAVATTVAASFADDPIWQWIYNTGDQTIPIETRNRACSHACRPEHAGRCDPRCHGMRRRRAVVGSGRKLFAGQ